MIDPTDDSEQMAALESIILSASSYVVPSDNLRPRTLEAAREYCNERVAWTRLQQCVLGFALCFAMCIPVFHRLVDWRSTLVAPSSDEMLKRGAIIAEREHQDMGWGLAEAFRDWRFAHASRFDASSTKTEYP